MNTVVKNIKLRNFRCHEEFELGCDRLITLIVGENGSGKTSVLEAIYLGLRGKSFKGVDREMLRREQDFYRVELALFGGDSMIVRYSNGVKEFEQNEKKTKRLPKDCRYPVILFEPDDLYLVGSSPTRRRDYFDRLFGQMDESYGVILGKYQRALKQRNDLLKRDGLVEDDLFSWDVMIAKYGVELARRRRRYVDLMNNKLTEVYREIAQNQDSCLLDYVDKNLDESAYLLILNKNLSRDILLGYTSFGVHRDDYSFMFNNKLANGSASRGEIRSMVLAMKFIEAEMITNSTHKKPLVLLDDIFSELDENRQKHLIRNFKEYQMIITSTTTPGDMMINKQL